MIFPLNRPMEEIRIQVCQPDFINTHAGTAVMPFPSAYGNTIPFLLLHRERTQRDPQEKERERMGIGMTSAASVCLHIIWTHLHIPTTLSVTGNRNGISHSAKKETCLRIVKSSATFDMHRRKCAELRHYRF
jgi:hypothetical protein